MTFSDYFDFNRTACDSLVVLMLIRSAFSSFLAQFKTRGVRKQAELAAFRRVRFDPSFVTQLIEIFITSLFMHSDSTFQ